MFDPKFRSNLDKLLPAFLDSFGDWIHIIDKNYKIVHINKSFLKINQKLNISTEVIGKNVFDIYPFVKNVAFSEYETVFRTKLPIIADNSVVIDGQLIYNNTTKWPLLINDNVEYIITIVKNTTENVLQLEREKQANILKKIILNFSAKLLNSAPNEEPALIADALKEISFFLKADRTYIYNYLPDKRAITLFKEYCQEGCDDSETIGQTIKIEEIPRFWQKLDQEEIVCVLASEKDAQDLLEEKKRFQYNEKLSLIAIGFIQDGQIQGFLALDVNQNSKEWFEANLTDLKLAANIFSNFFAKRNYLAENQKLERQLLQAQRIESIGRLAGGIAHDFNNILTSIMGNVTLGLMDLEYFPVNPVYLHEYLGDIKKAVESASNLTKQLLTFSRQQIGELKVQNLNQILQNLEKMIQRLIREDIEFQLDLASDLKNVRVDASQIEQIVVNLVVNARDAMENGGKLYISTKNESDMVCLSISDTGCGMDDNVKAHLFEPFFTTKPKDKGTGLGLAIVYSLVQKNNGNVSVYSEVGHGTTFKIKFPIIDESLPAPNTTTSLDPNIKRDFTVIFVEDEEMVRKSTKETLNRLGYRLFDFSKGADALLYLKNLKIPPDVIVSDVIMPGMNGREFAANVRKIFPDVSFIFISGYTDDYLNGKGILGEIDAFLSKPFTITQMDQKIQEVLKKQKKI